MADIITYSTNKHTSTDVQGLTEIKSTLNPINQETKKEPIFKNTVSKQKDVTIDLSQFLDPIEEKKFFNNENNV